MDEDLVVRKFRTTAADGKMYNIKYYNLDMIVAIGFRVRSNIGTNFRKWANDKLTEYITKGFTMNDDLLKRAGGGLYFDELLSRIRDIRSSEKVFWRKVLDIYATSVDYDPKAEITKDFFKTVQNKMHWLHIEQPFLNYLKQSKGYNNIFIICNLLFFQKKYC